MRSLFVFALLLVAVAAVVPRDQRVVGSELATVGQFPYTVGLITRINLLLTGQCAGSLVSANFILTAARCVAGPAIAPSVLAEDAPKGRVVGGDLAAVGQFPYSVGLITHSTSIFTGRCAGSLISANYVLTAASCVQRFVLKDVPLGIRVNPNFSLYLTVPPQHLRTSEDFASTINRKRDGNVC
uniref:Peptidase S1 domain-containing protein n=1 Tax=Anopheles stephensi TaxID=30069 RepID=A0A182YD47_ANOST